MGSKRYRTELEIPEDKPEELRTLLAMGVSAESVYDLANRVLVGTHFGPRAGFSDAAHVLRAIQMPGLIDKTPELAMLVYPPGMFDDWP